MVKEHGIALFQGHASNLDLALNPEIYKNSNIVHKVYRSKQRWSLIKYIFYVTFYSPKIQREIYMFYRFTLLDLRALVTSYFPHSDFKQ